MVEVPASILFQTMCADKSTQGKQSARSWPQISDVLPLARECYTVRFHCKAAVKIQSSPKAHNNLFLGMAINICHI